MPSFACTFVAPNGTLLPAFDPHFYAVNGDLVIETNAACGTTGGSVVDVAGVSGAFSSAQFSEGIVARLGGVSYAGLALRCGGAGSGNGYWWISIDAGNSFFGYIAAGVFNTILTLPVFAAGDLVRMEGDGPNFNLLVNGVSVATAVDATFATGVPGVAGFRNDFASGMATLRVGDLRPSGLFMPAFVGGF